MSSDEWDAHRQQLTSSTWKRVEWQMAVVLLDFGLDKYTSIAQNASVVGVAKEETNSRGNWSTKEMPRRQIRVKARTKGPTTTWLRNSPANQKNTPIDGLLHDTPTHWGTFVWVFIWSSRYPRCEFRNALSHNSKLWSDNSGRPDDNRCAMASGDTGSWFVYRSWPRDPFLIAYIQSYIITSSFNRNHLHLTTFREWSEPIKRILWRKKKQPREKGKQSGVREKTSSYDEEYYDARLPVAVIDRNC